MHKGWARYLLSKFCATDVPVPDHHGNGIR